jgi:hypothetical protein
VGNVIDCGNFNWTWDRIQWRDSGIGVTVLRIVQQQEEASAGERFRHSIITKPIHTQREERGKSDWRANSWD